MNDLIYHGSYMYCLQNEKQNQPNKQTKQSKDKITKQNKTNRKNREKKRTIKKEKENATKTGTTNNEQYYLNKSKPPAF